MVISELTVAKRRPSPLVYVPASSTPLARGDALIFITLFLVVVHVFVVFGERGSSSHHRPVVVP